ncbi:hypothetical protein DFP72DRAFT_1132426 [Ephemerocybe angulata]|uniref:Uncharacterized protein n=1 Tax=Ephemerocybe angulata TaxID=980116 RepID=A0A8H6HU72_9AGAR|nr:hypothetical protein DFP72DRAFT_1132426 [Tulosesus angulatus]
MLHHASITLSPLFLPTALIILSHGLPQALALPHLSNGALASPDRHALSCAFGVAGYSIDLCALAGEAIWGVEEAPPSSPSAPVAVDKEPSLSRPPRRPRRSTVSLSEHGQDWECDLDDLKEAWSLTYGSSVWSSRCRPVERAALRITEEETGDQNAGEGEFVKPHRPTWESSRRWIAGLLLVLGVAAICITTIVSSPRLRHFVLEKAYSISFTLSPLASRAAGAIRTSAPFRQGDSRLVQWAEEDMSLQEDFMVNGSGAYELDGEDWNGTNLDEYIPLTFSPKRYGRKIRSYGATPSRETFMAPGMGGRAIA